MLFDRVFQLFSLCGSLHLLSSFPTTRESAWFRKIKRHFQLEVLGIRNVHRVLLGSAIVLTAVTTGFGTVLVHNPFVPTINTGARNNNPFQPTGSSLPTGLKIPLVFLGMCVMCCGSFLWPLYKLSNSVATAKMNGKFIGDRPFDAKFRREKEEARVISCVIKLIAIGVIFIGVLCVLQHIHMPPLGTVIEHIHIRPLGTLIDHILKTLNPSNHLKP